MAISFSFGRNWKSFAKYVSEAKVQEAQADLVNWLGAERLAGKTVVDVGSGSGIHSLGFFRLGAKSIVSLDVDRYSVECTRDFWKSAGEPGNWRVAEISILDSDEVAALGEFDIVYSWGVLHHTGQMWKAIENASRLGKSENALLWISLYAKGPNYDDDLALKQRFNDASPVRKQAMVLHFLQRRWRNERRTGKSFKAWFWRGRGMNAYHDAIDWFGGLPYEVASVEEVTAFLAERGWIVDRVNPSCEGGCSNYLFRR